MASAAAVALDNVSDLIECVVCSERYDDDNHKPLALPRCGHTLCKFCLGEMVQNSKLTCPICNLTSNIKRIQTLREPQIPISRLMARLPNVDNEQRQVIISVKQAKDAVEVAKKKRDQIAANIERVKEEKQKLDAKQKELEAEYLVTLREVARSEKHLLNAEKLGVEDNNVPVNLQSTDARQQSAKDGNHSTMSGDEFHHCHIRQSASSSSASNLHVEDVAAALGRVFAQSEYTLSEVELVLEPLSGDVRRRVVDTAVDGDGDPVIVAAAWDGYLDIVKYLRDTVGADVNKRGGEGVTAVLVASSGGHIGVVMELVEGGASVESARDNGWTCLMMASDNGHVEVVRYLLQRGANVNAVDELGETALLWAAYRGHLPVVKVLLQGGARWNVTDCNGDSPLQHATSRGHHQVAQYLRQWADTHRK